MHDIFASVLQLMPLTPATWTSDMVITFFHVMYGREAVFMPQSWALVAVPGAAELQSCSKCAADLCVKARQLKVSVTCAMLIG